MFCDAGPGRSSRDCTVRWTSCGHAACSTTSRRPAMDDLGPRVAALLDRAADGEIGDAPVNDIVRRGSRRRRMRTAVLTTSAAVATAAVVSTVALMTTSSGGDHSPARPGPTATTSRPPLPPTTGIAATAVAHGRWTNIAPAPIKLCAQTSVAWTGSVIVVVSLNDAVDCASAAAAYDPRRDRWHRLDAPPPGIGGQVVLVPAGG